jgi:hypothetical protein
MSKVHYTLQQAMRLQPALTAMVKDVIYDVVSTFKETNGFKKTYKLITDQNTGEFELFEFNVARNPLDALTDGKKITDRKAWRNRPVGTATTFLNGKPWAITFQQEDLDKSPEDALKDPSVEMVAQQLLEHIVGGMATHWYFHGLHDRIALWNSESQFDAIRDHFDGMIEAQWDEFGYSVDVLAPHPEAKEPGNLVLIKRDVSYNALPRHKDPNNPEVKICQRYLDLGIITLIALGLTEKGFSWTLN